MIIRHATAADAAGIAAIYNDAVRHTTAVLVDTEVDAQNRADWMAGRQAQGYPVLVAVEGAEVMAYASYGDFRPSEGYRGTVENSIYVSPAARGRGLAPRLLGDLIDHARTIGKHVMVAVITAENEISIRLHARAGFVGTAILREVGQKFGRWHDVAFMELRLDDRPSP
jgi:L-amino acid N-acyltransferase YncA